jgi:predicted nucleic acid-binding protein
MDEEIACDTTFLIDLQRSSRNRSGVAAHQFLERYDGSRFSLSAIALGEFAAGFADERDAALVEIKRHFAVLPLDEAVALTYRTIFRELRRAGNLIGANDLWIAATALRYDLPLVTSNHTEFTRIRRLRVLRY